MSVDHPVEQSGGLRGRAGDEDFAANDDQVFASIAGIGVHLLEHPTTVLSLFHNEVSIRETLEAVKAWKSGLRRASARIP